VLALAVAFALPVVFLVVILSAAKDLLFCLPFRSSSFAKAHAGDPASQSATAPSANGAPYTSLGQTGVPGELARWGGSPQENKPRRRRFRSAEGWSEGEAEATELPSSTSPQPSPRGTACQGGSSKSCQAPKPPKSNKTKRKIAAHYIHSTLYNRNRA